MKMVRRSLRPRHPPPSTSFRFLAGAPPFARRVFVRSVRLVYDAGIEADFARRAGDGKSDITTANARARCYVFLTCTGGEDRDPAAVASRNCEPASRGTAESGRGPGKLTFFSLSPRVPAIASAIYVYACMYACAGVIAPFAAGCNATRTTQAPERRLRRTRFNNNLIRETQTCYRPRIAPITARFTHDSHIYAYIARLEMAEESHPPKKKSSPY